MTLDFCPYELVARSDGRRREGALLRVGFADGVRGYADLHPWPTLGDAPLDRQLAALGAERPEPLAVCSLGLARVDGEARAEGRSLFEGLTVPPSHASLPFGFTPDDLAKASQEGYTRVKLKGWTFSADDLAFFRASGLKFRLDFNAGLAADEVHRLLDGWGDPSWIDWLEDPCPYDPAAWDALRERVRVAIDFERGATEFDVWVVKPARDSGEWGVASREWGVLGSEFGGRRGVAFSRGGDRKPFHSPFPTRHSSLPTPHSPLAAPHFAFTSYLDHPVGQLGAAWVAARAVADGRPVEPGGLVTQEVYEPTVFSQRLDVREARLVPPDGPGLGFGPELEALEWRTLRP